MEQVLDWLNENERRSYPLLDSVSKVIVVSDNEQTLPDNFILDLQICGMGTDLAEPDGRNIPVYLKKIKYTAGELEIAFGTTSTELAVFTLGLSTASFPTYLRTSDGNLVVLGVGVVEFWELCGRTSFEAQVYLPVEPATVSQFDKAWLGVHSIATAPEKVSKNATDVGIARSYEPLLPLIPMSMSTQLTGNVKFLEGYNYRLDLSQGDVGMEVGSGFGLRQSCQDSFILPEYLDCGELVSYINGIPPDASGNFNLVAGSNIEITAGTVIDTFLDDLTETANTHTLFVGLTFQSTDLCAPVNIIPATQ